MENYWCHGFGACSTVEDVVALVEFIKEIYVAKKKSKQVNEA